MTAFITLDSLPRAFFALWAFSLCLVGIVNLILPLWKKRWLFSVIALLFLLPVVFVWQVIFDIALWGKLGIAPSVVSERLGDVSWGLWLVAFIVITALELLLLTYDIRYEKRHLTLGSVKLYLDKIPCGICCWTESGRVLFSNTCMNDLCASLTGVQLLNGKRFYDAVAGKMLTVDGRMWRFTARELLLDGEKTHEMIASDITDEYAETVALEKDKAELDRINRELKEYNLNIDETVRRQEILQAKVNIHDEMNRLMLSTVSAEKEDDVTMDTIFSLWEQNALLLCMQADETSDKRATDRMNELAEALKIRLIWQGALPSVFKGEQRNLFFSAAQEAIINAAKHAGAKEMMLSFAVTEGSVECRFTNDGKIPSVPVTFTGGLLNLQRLAEEQGATITTSVGERFTLFLRFPACDQPIG